MRRFVPGLLALVTASAGFAQGTITDGDVNFVRTASSFDTTPEANLTGIDGGAAADHVYEHGWWFRLSGGTQESAFGAPGTQFYSGNESFVDWSGLGGGAFDASESVTVFDLTPGGVYDGGYVHFELEISNPSASSPLSVTIFHALDLDVNGAAAGDSGALFAFDPYRVLAIEDSAGLDAFYVAEGPAESFLARPFGATSVRSVLNDAAVTVFDNTGVPVGLEDITVGFQFPVNLPPLGSLTLVLDLYFSLYPAPCGHVDGLYCDGLNVGSTTLWSSVSP